MGSSRRGHTMSGQVGDAADGITLDLNVWAQHLANKRLKATQFDDE